MQIEYIDTLFGKRAIVRRFGEYCARVGRLPAERRRDIGGASSALTPESTGSTTRSTPSLMLTQRRMLTSVGASV
jgi:hypothetical protein